VTAPVRRDKRPRDGRSLKLSATVKDVADAKADIS
jgi:hypothetical protein